MWRKQRELDTALKDYSEYKLKRRDWILCVGESAGLSALAAWLLYKSVYGMVLFPFLLPIVVKSRKNRMCEWEKEELLAQFGDCMQSVTMALQAGYSMENAWKESEKELVSLHGEETSFVKELTRINAAVGVNQPIEKLLYEFALRSDCEDIQNFSEVFLFAKRSGGDFCKIMQTTIHHIREKTEVESEIQTILSAKKMEQKIMNIIPVGLLLYLNMTAPDFLAGLYGNLVGRIIMTTALGVYMAAVWISERIVRIRV